MPRTGDTYTIPSGTDGITDRTIASTPYNLFIHDVEFDLNAARPVVAGGTGGTNATQARVNLAAEVAGKLVANYDSHIWENGSFYSLPNTPGEPVTAGYFSGVCHKLNDAHITLHAYQYGTGNEFRKIKSSGVWSPWVSQGAAGDTVNVSGDTMTGHLALPPGPAANQAVRRDYVDAADAILTANVATNTANIANNTANINAVTTSANNRVLRAGDAMTGRLTIEAINGTLFLRSGSTGQPNHVGLGRATNDEMVLGIAAAANNFVSGSAAGDGVLNVPSGNLRFGANGMALFILNASGGIGRGSSFQTQYNMNTGVNGISMKGGDTSTTKAFIDFADSALTHCGSINVNQSAHTTAYATSSDERGKPNKEKISSVAARAVIDALEIYDFDKDGNTIRGYGVVAQQAYKAHKSLAFPPQNENDFWAVEKAAPVPFLIAALQGANQMIDKLEERLKALEDKLASKPA